MDLSGHTPIDLLIHSLFTPTPRRQSLRMLNTRAEPPVRNRNVRINYPLMVTSILNSLVPGSTTDIGQIIQNSMNDTGGLKKKASKDFVASLKHPETISGEYSCGVCQDDIDISERKNILELPCKHMYHTDCILPWFEKSNTCPICRTEFDSEEVHNHISTDTSESTNHGNRHHPIVDSDDDSVDTNLDDDELDLSGTDRIVRSLVNSMSHLLYNYDTQSPSHMSHPLGVLSMMPRTRQLLQPILAPSAGLTLNPRMTTTSPLSLNPRRSTRLTLNPRSSTVDEDAQLQEIILRSLHDYTGTDNSGNDGNTEN